MTQIPAIIVTIGIALTAGGTVWGVRDFAAAKRLLVAQDAMIAQQIVTLTDAQATLTRTQQEHAVMKQFVRTVVAPMPTEAAP